MQWFLVVFFFCFFLSIISVNRHRNSKYYWLFLCLLLIMTAGFRNMGGSDYFVYQDDYLGLKSYDGNGLKAMFEVGYTTTVLLGNLLHLNYNEFICAFTSLSLILLFRFYWKFSPYPFLSLMLYMSTFFLYYNMVAMRQMLPLALVPYAIYYLATSRYWCFFLIIIIGTSFHNSFAVLLLFTPFILYFKPTSRNLLILLVMAFIVQKSISSFIENLIDSTSSASIALRMSELSGGDGSFSLVFLLKTFSLLFFLMCYKKLFAAPMWRIYYNCFLVSLLLVFCFAGNMMIFRLTAYFDFSITLLIPHLIKNVSSTYKTKRYWYVSLCAFSVFLFYRAMYIMDDGDFLNYSFYFL